ncbi:hypothetical protein, partial [Rhodanobacter fulvus]|uniref:hypothetical protein n=1 Tax=Rhodanobacter fulvus TaxID=219571 RepID=UPI001ED91097
MDLAVLARQINAKRLGLMTDFDEVLAAERAKDGEALRQALSKAKVPASILMRLLLDDWHDLH